MRGVMSVKKRVVSFFTVLFLIACLPFAVSGGSEPPTLVYDEADVLTASQETALQERLYEVTKEQKCYVMVVTVDSLGYRTADGYAADYYRQHGFGWGSDKSGEMLLLAMSSRDYAIYTYGDGHERLHEDDLEQIEEEMLPHLSRNDYVKAFTVFADTCEEGLDDSFDLGTNLLIAVAIGAIVAFAILQGMKAQLRSVRPRREATEYVRAGSFDLRHSRDVFLYRNVTRVRRASQNSSGRRSGGGRSGGRSGKF